MTNPIETTMYDISQFFLYPVLLAIAALFVHAFYALGAFIWQAWQRAQGRPAGFELHSLRRADPAIDLVALETVAVKRLEFARIATRVAPMLGLVATMIPMGPALKALADGALQDVSRSLMVAFSAVILALLAAAISFTVVNVRKRWYSVDLAAIEAEITAMAAMTAMAAAQQTHPAAAAIALNEQGGAA